MKKILYLLILTFIFCMQVKAEDLAPNSKSAILMEVSTGEILYAKNEKEKLPPASMTKIMSMLLIMEAIDDGKLSFDDEVIISENASGMGGSQIFLQAGEKYKVKELLKGIAIASGNDAVVAMAEKVSGSVGAFVDRMNEKAKALGLTNTHFDNPHGLDSNTHYTTASDMAIMAKELLKHEKILEFTSIYEDYLTKNNGTSTWLVNTNKLVRFYEGVDGLKTGFTTTAGYCITTTAKRNGMRLLSVVMDAPTSDLRSKDTVSLLNYGFNTYKLETILTKDSDLGTIKLEKGKLKETKVYLKEDITNLKKISDPDMQYTYNLTVDKIKAPVLANEKVGNLELIDNNGNIVNTYDVIVKEEVKKASIIDLFKNVLSCLTTGEI